MNFLQNVVMLILSVRSIKLEHCIGMSACMDIKTKVEILRQYETYYYQISYYLIQDEELSIQAVCEAY